MEIDTSATLAMTPVDSIWRIYFCDVVERQKIHNTPLRNAPLIESNAHVSLGNVPSARSKDVRYLRDYFHLSYRTGVVTII